MIEYNDAILNELISAGKDATRELSSLKLKKQTPRIRELLGFRRSRLILIRKRATELNLTETDLNNIHTYIQDKNS